MSKCHVVGNHMSWLKYFVSDRDEAAAAKEKEERKKLLIRKVGTTSNWVATR